MEHGRLTAATRGLARWLSGAAPSAVKGAVTLAVVPDSEVQRLNRRFRGYNKPTDVLSFPFGGRSKLRGPFPVTPYLGDIVIARGVAGRQARSLGHTIAVEFRVLALHGLLHLLGYDHETDSGRMARVEARLRRKAGLPPGLIARSS